MSSGTSRIKNTVCQKICYKTKRLALKKMDELNSEPNTTFKLKSVYLCPEHKEWHVTSMSKGVADQIIWKNNKRENIVHPDQDVIQKRIEYLEGANSAKNKFKNKKYGG